MRLKQNWIMQHLMVQQILEKIVYNVILMEIEYMLQMVNILNQMLRMLLMDRDIILIMFLIMD